MNQPVEKGPSASLRSTSSLDVVKRVRLRSSVSRAPRTWDLFDQAEEEAF
jgi:hypothetical protein